MDGVVTNAWHTGPNPLAPDLDACKVREYVTYSGDGTGTATFMPSNPPFAWSAPLENPTTFSFDADIGGLIDDHDDGRGGVPTFSHPYRNASFTGTQYYQFNCSICMDTGEWENLQGPLYIERSVYLDDPGWWFRVSKEGYTSFIQLSTTPAP